MISFCVTKCKPRIDQYNPILTSYRVFFFCFALKMDKYEV